jgi:hypothetical protein
LKNGTLHPQEQSVSPIRVKGPTTKSAETLARRMTERPVMAAPPRSVARHHVRGCPRHRSRSSLLKDSKRLPGILIAVVGATAVVGTLDLGTRYEKF